LQAEFPLVPRPFTALGDALDLDEDQLLDRVRRLKDAGIIRQISAIFDTRRLGYQSTLVAFHVPDVQLEGVAALVSAHPGVSHNYARPHHYNLWFTLAVPPGHDVAAEIDRLSPETGIDDLLNLPAIRVFKIRARFKLQESHSPQTQDDRDSLASQARAFTPADVPFVQALQEDLALVPQPFAAAAGRLGVSEAALMKRAGELKSAGIMRRFSAVLRHRRLGYTANGMACWIVPDGRIEEVGRRAAEFPQVSHCYQRPAYPPRWPYALFTMVHGQTKDEVDAIVAEIARETGLDQYEVLFSTREFKKERVRYFEEEP
jgi:DNA-binding Lrp family transcriptional regulator